MNVAIAAMSAKEKNECDSDSSFEISQWLDDIANKFETFGDVSISVESEKIRAFSNLLRCNTSQPVFFESGTLVKLKRKA